MCVFFSVIIDAVHVNTFCKYSSNLGNLVTQSIYMQIVSICLTETDGTVLTGADPDQLGPIHHYHQITFTLGMCPP